MEGKAKDEARFYTDNIRTFVAVAEHGGIGRAARALGLTQPSVSQQTARLEALIGRKLFKRSSAGVALTTDGEILLRHAQSMIDINELIDRDFSITRNRVALTLGLSEMFSLTTLQRVLWLLTKQNPALALRIVLGPEAMLTREFEARELDVMVVGSAEPRPDGELVCTKAMTWIGSSQAEGPVQDPVPLVLPIAPSRVRALMLGALSEARRSWTTTFEVTSVSVAETATEAGFGYSAVLREIELRGPVQVGSESGLPDLPGLDFYLSKQPGRRDDLISALCGLLKAAAAST